MADFLRLDSEQQIAVTTKAKRLYVTAPAGSGKTSVLVARARWLVHLGCDPHKLLVITFAKKASIELRNRLRAAGLSSITVKTFHAFAYQLLQQQHTEPFRLVHDLERNAILRSLLTLELHAQTRDGNVLRNFLRQRNWSPTFLARESIRHIERARNFGITLSEIWEYERNTGSTSVLSGLCSRLWFLYEQLLTKHGQFDFPMLITAAIRGMDNLYARGSRHTHILVDEVQDAARSEILLLERFVEQQRDVTYVGDGNQALYGWRGATKPTLTKFSHVTLQKNYRSDGFIIRAANYFVYRHLKEDRVMQATHASRYKPVFILHTKNNELTVIHTLIKQLVEQGYSPHKIMILVRTNAAALRVKDIKKHYQGVTVLTVHAAKGLEAPVVIVLNIHGGRFGFPQDQQENPEIWHELTHHNHAQEEKRIFYVALTRAQERLYLLTADAATGFAQTFLKYQQMRHVTLQK